MYRTILSFDRINGSSAVMEIRHEWFYYSFTLWNYDLVPV